MRKETRFRWGGLGGIVILCVIAAVCFFTGRREHLSIDLENVTEIQVDCFAPDFEAHLVPEEQWELLKTELERLELVPIGNTKESWCWFTFKYNDGLEREVSLSGGVVVVSDKNRREGVSEVKYYRPKNFDGDAFQVFLEKP